MLPASLTGRVVGAFALLAVVLWLAIGATMFVVLAALHAEATSASLADIAQTLAVRLRGAVADGRSARSSPRSAMRSRSSDVTVHLARRRTARSSTSGPADPGRPTCRSRSRRRRGSATR